MKFVIRDDDLNFFSQPSDIERWYSDIFAQNIPVGFSTIPFVKGTSDVYKKSNENKEFPISGNRELIEYIKGNNFVEILQHGSTHENNGGVFEYAQNRDLTTDTLRGKAELEKSFSNHFKPIFVPPHDWIGKKGIDAIERAQLNLIRGRGTGFKNIRPSLTYIKNFLKTLFAKPVYPYVLDFGRHKEVFSFRLEDEDIFDGLDFIHKKDGVFVVVTHLHFYTEEKKAKLIKLIEKARNFGYQFVKPSELFRS